MAYWLFIALCIIWVVHTLSILFTCYQWFNLSPHGRRIAKIKPWAAIEIILWINFTIFWWSWVLFG